MGSEGALTKQRDLLNKRDMQVLMLGGTYRKLKRGQLLIEAGAPLTFVYKITKGKVSFDVSFIVVFSFFVLFCFFFFCFRLIVGKDICSIGQ